MTEIELKFGVAAGHAAAVDAALRRLPSQRVALESRYFDTTDFRLAAAGLALRLRRTGRVWEQTLKVATAQVAERLEETVPRPGRWGADGPPLDPALHDATAAGKALRAVLNDAGETGRLQRVHTCRVVRRSADVEALGARVEVAFDRGAIHAGEASLPVCEVEYELKQGDAAMLIEFGRAGVCEHAMWLSTASKAARGTWLARGEAGGPPVKASVPRLQRTMSGPAIFRTVLAACLDQVLANASEIAAGERDAELIHQLRVGLRRTRTAWLELAGLAGHSDAGWLLPLAAGFAALGEYRDRTTVVAALQERLVQAGSPAPRLPEPAAEPADPVEVVRAADFQCALLDGLALTMAVPRESDAAAGAEPADAAAARRRIDARLDALHRQLRNGARTFEQASEEAQHRVRKRLKRLRYLAELVGTLYKPARVERYIEVLGPAQDALGAHVDLLVGLALARQAAQRGEAAAWFNVGWLTAQLASSARHCRKALARAAKAGRFWRR
ncbi:MAG: CYTH and CHAD domain-containing protein [Caldimonas sp.]